MKPQARIQTTIDILEKIQSSHIPMDGRIGDYMRQRRYIGAKDRAAVVERVYDIVRHHARLGWWLSEMGQDDTPRNRVLAFLMLVEDASEKRISDLFDGSKYAPEPVTPAEQSFIQKSAGKTPEYPEEIAAECPPRYVAQIKALWGDDFAAEMAAMLETATLDLRVNTFLADQEKVKNYLEADGVPTNETPYSPWGLRCRRKHISRAPRRSTKAGLKFKMRDRSSLRIWLMRSRVCRCWITAPVRAEKHWRWPRR